MSARSKTKQKPGSSEREPRALTDGYVAKLLGMPIALIPPNLLEAKRRHLQVHRLMKIRSTASTALIHRAIGLQIGLAQGQLHWSQLRAAHGTEKVPAGFFGPSLDVFLNDCIPALNRLSERLPGAKVKAKRPPVR